MKFLIKVPFSSLIFVFLCFAVCLSAFGNAGPTFWQGYPTTEMLVIDENCPIVIERENLVFDLRGDHSSEHTIKGRVAASYQMKNPLGEAVSVQMAFPFVSSLNSFSTADTVIEADGETLPFDMYIGDALHGHGRQSQGDMEAGLAFEEVVGTITRLPYAPKSFTVNEKAKLYQIEAVPTTDQGINLAVDFTYDSDKTRVLVGGFNRFERDEGKVRIAAWCYSPEVLEIIVLGDDLDFDITVYADGQLKEKTDRYSYEVVTKEMELMPYLMEYVERKTPKIVEEFHGQQLYNLYAASVDRDLLYNKGFCIYSDLLQQNHQERVLTALYTVDFPADSYREVAVGYEITGTMDRTQTLEPIYTFNYILNPAENWGGFRDLNIEIYTSDDSPHILESNIKLEKKGNGYYTASMEALPDTDFVFSTHANERVHALDKVQIFFHNVSWFFVFFGIPVLVIIVVAAIIYKNYREL
ncbi:MAG TPA: hypothetical protein VFD15_01015 [Clostridia bacterium]|nr:hypothetical protein [Clostridia bacterium]